MCFLWYNVNRYRSIRNTYLFIIFIKRGFKMEITSLKLVNFRNFDNLELNFSNNKNIIIGDNGVGKTNIVEAIFVLALTKSFRTN